MSQFLSLLGWGFLPSFVSGWVQTIYYGITIRAGDPKPLPGSPRFASDRRAIHILVVALYLLYTIYEADWALRREGSFYTDLGVPFAASDRDVKARFRRLAALHHPDKAASTSSAADATSAYFIHLKLASDTLQDAAKRFAYERFGPDVVRWQRCASVRDYLSVGVLSVILPHYAAAAAAVYGLGLFGYMDFGRFWRWLIMLALCLFEIQAVTRPRFPLLVDAANALLTTISGHPPFLPFQMITLARKLAITIYIAFNQIGPLLQQQQQQQQQQAGGRRGADDEDKMLRHGLEQLEKVTALFDADVTRLVEMEMAPYKGDPEGASNLTGKMREWLVQNTIRADPMVRDAMGNSLRRRRIDVPAGANGNR
ncbi:Chaperone protein DnaJ [Escovopsis weberi]|uniref:Chaperone protein DnaJ n=1 Tax=Escovopsis weberi TaxID=150374 RepID=A0A0M8N5E0_ESCWE|nr:Chaperone protein DnaJ [Escovopsis weberi]